MGSKRYNGTHYTKRSAVKPHFFWGSFFREWAIAKNGHEKVTRPDLNFVDYLNERSNPRK